MPKEKRSTRLFGMRCRIEGSMKAFACYNTDEKVRRASSSGGVYSLIAEKIIADGGIVAAAVYNDKLEVEHTLCTTREELEKTRGSKYQPSHLGDIFKTLKAELERGRVALFVGTPCQCAGLLAFLSKPYENLFVVDFICHGVPSRLAWREYVKSLGARGFKLKSVNMRDKSRSWSSYRWLLEDEKGRVKSENHSDNPFMKGFVANIYLRPSCFECRFKGVERKTDFTLGDYWGVASCQSDMYDDRGTSLVFVHSEKGEKLFNEISQKMKVSPANLEKALFFNTCAVKSVEKTPKREVFFKSVCGGEDFISTVNRLVKKPFVKSLKRRIKRILGR